MINNLILESYVGNRGHKCQMRSLLYLTLLLILSIPVIGGTNQSGDWFTHCGSGGNLSWGDYVTSADAGGFDTTQSFYLEVPADAATLTVEIFDADIGLGGAAEGAANLDNLRTSWDTSCQYTLFNPGGTQVATVQGDGSGPALSHNAWYQLYTTANPTAGHWELRVDMSSAETDGNDQNTFGIRAHDGTSGSGGTEINIYSDSYLCVGTLNYTAANDDNRAYDFYPYVCAGCTVDANEWDWDSNSATQAGNQIVVTSRTGVHSTTIPQASLSVDNVWANHTTTSWTTDTLSADYGIWVISPTIYESTTGTNNFDTFYVGSELTSNPAPSAQPEINSHRIYFPTDGGGAPVKPFLTQTLTHVSGPNPPTQNNTTRVRIDVTMFNNNGYDITFSSSNLVSASLPGDSQVAYVAGSASITSGTIVSQPAGSATAGSITWNPGTIGNGNTSETLHYFVDVTPTNNPAGRIVVTGTPSLNGTTATFVDKTGNTTQARATFTFGPICELAANGIIPTQVFLGSFKAYDNGKQTVVEWNTNSEIGTAGFNLERLDHQSGTYLQVNKKLLPGLNKSPQGGTYRFIDEDALPGKTYTYQLVEIESKGRSLKHGPFTLKVEDALDYEDPMASQFDSDSHEVSDEKASRIRERQQALRTLEEGRSYRGPNLKMAIRDRGLYYVSASDLATELNIPERKLIKLLQGKQFSLKNMGNQVAYILAENGAGLFYYAEGIDSIYTDQNIYSFSEGKGRVMTVEDTKGPRPFEGHATFTQTVHAEEDHWTATALFDDPESDYWLWDFIIAGESGKSYTIRGNGVAGKGKALLNVHLKGATNTEINQDHHVKLKLNGVEIGEGFFGGTEGFDLSLPLNPSLLEDGDNVIEVAGILNTGAPYSIFYVESFDLTYERFYRAVDDEIFIRGGDNEIVTISGFSSSDIFLFDLSNALSPKYVEGFTVDQKGGSYRISFVPGRKDIEYLALTPSAWKSPLSFATTSAQVDEGKSETDYIVISPLELQESAQALATYRKGKLVILEDIYDTFSYGIATPHAIKAFLNHAYRQWRTTPRYVVLAGEGTFDYKNNQGHSDNLLPVSMVNTSYGLFASDNWFADVVGNDGVPEMAIGRLPVMTNTELGIMVEKIRNYERGNWWTIDALMLADNPDSAGNFSSDSNDIASMLPNEDTRKVYLSENTITMARNLLLSGIDDGVLLLNYIGHGGLDRLASEGMLLTSDVASMNNADHLPILAAMTCLTGRFALPGYDSLGEALVLHGTGGAIAVWAPTGLSVNSYAKKLDKAFFRAMFKREGVTVGEAILEALQNDSSQGGSPSELEIYNFLGDPALKMR